MESEELFRELDSTFQFTEPSEADLSDELARLTDDKAEGRVTDRISTPNAGTELIDELERLTLSLHSSNLQSTASKEEALNALRQSENVSASVEKRLDDVQAKLKKVSTAEDVSALKSRAVCLKREGNMKGAKEALLQARERKTAKGREALKGLVERLTAQAKLSQEAALYYERTGKTENARLFLSRKRAAEQEMAALVDLFKKGDVGLPEVQEATVTFETQPFEADVNEKDLLIDIKPDKWIDNHYVRIIFECPSGNDAKLIPLSECLNEPGRILFSSLSRDIRQQKFFEHRRLKIELLEKNKKTLLFIFTSAPDYSLKATGHVKLYPLCTATRMTASLTLAAVRLSLVLRVRFPISKRDPVKHKEQFMFIPSLDLHKDCRYTLPAIVDDSVCLASYVVLEKESERLAMLCEQPDCDSSILEKKAGVDCRLAQLAASVGSGELEMHEYLQRVKDAILLTKKACLTAKCCGDLVTAKRLLSYAKMMQEEVTEAEGIEQ